ncbi:MAG: enoyl-CoA hydratase/isomerase family protein [Actinomycetes bacterium]
MECVRTERVRDGIDLVTLDRPDRLNAMNTALVTELDEALRGCAEDDSCRVVVLTGAGRAFCAGLDLVEGAASRRGAGKGRTQAGLHTQQMIAALVPRLRGMRKPVIAAVNGAASGGGLALALACDIRIGGRSSRFNVAFVKIGLSGCDIGVSWLLPRIVGTGPAFHMMLTGRMVEAEEAERMGIITRLVADDALLDAALAEAELIVGNSPFGVWMTKEVMWSQLEVGSLQAGIDLENRTQILASTTGDMEEAVSAFLERRTPQWGDR